jgi:hypothetical protein
MNETLMDLMTGELMRKAWCSVDHDRFYMTAFAITCDVAQSLMPYRLIYPNVSCGNDSVRREYTSVRRELNTIVAIC